MKSWWSVFGMGILVLAAANLHAATPEEIRAAIEAKFTLTQRSKWTGKVTQAGTVAVIQKAGTNADPETRLAMQPVIIKHGAIEHAGGGMLMGGDTGLSLKPGDKVYLYDVRVSDDNVTILYGTVDSIELTERGSTRREYYKGALRFQYDGGVAALQPQRILADIETWIKTEADSASSTATTISIGQTPDQVVAILGAPGKQVDLGSKKIFIYKDMKVVFIDGKVSDVQ